MTYWKTYCILGCHAQSRTGLTVSSMIWQAVETVLDYLTELGHRKIAFIGGYEVDRDGEEVYDSRIVAYKEYMERIGEFRQSLVRLGRFTPEDGYVLCRELLEEKERPTAVFARNDALAVGCYRAVSEKGLQISGRYECRGI